MSSHRLAARAAVCSALLALASTDLAAQGLCIPRNGSGANPNGFACVSDPLIGTTWQTTVDIATPQAAASAVAVFLGGPLPGVALPYGELLCNPPTLTIHVAAGAHAIPIPHLGQLVGSPFCAQAATLKLGPLRIQLQNAIDLTVQAAGTETITVLVIDETTLLPVSGASVVLQGTDAASAGGLAGTTDANGEIAFVGVTGPYTVTAQADLSTGSTTTRVGVSLVEISPLVAGSPPAGTIGVPLDSEVELSLPVNATLSGVVANRPVLSGSEYLEVLAVARGGVDFDERVTVNPTTGAYSMSIPAGATLDCLVVHRANAFQFHPPVLASLLAPGVGPAAPGATLVRNFDFASAAVVPWSMATTFSVSNAHPALDLGVELALVDPANGVEISLQFFGGSSAPSPIDLPNVLHSGFAGYQLSLETETFDPFGAIEASQDCNLSLTSNPASIALSLFSLPALLWPPDNGVLTVPQLDALTVLLVEGSTGGFGANGVSLFWLETSGPPGSGVADVSWTILFRPGTSTFDLPRYGLPMFAPNQTVHAGLEQVRFQGVPFAFDTFFDASIASHFSGLASATETCDSGVEIDLYLVP